MLCLIIIDYLCYHVQFQSSVLTDTNLLYFAKASLLDILSCTKSDLTCQIFRMLICSFPCMYG